MPEVVKASIHIGEKLVVEKKTERINKLHPNGKEYSYDSDLFLVYLRILM